MAKQLFANNVSVSIMEELTAADTTITVSSTARFPTIASGDWIIATIVPSGGSGSNEVVKITAFSGNNLTVVRGQESTTAQSFLFGSFLELRVTKGSLEELRDFTQTGTGATLRTKADKLKDFVSVKDFGAVGDGTTDDTVAIQAAINSGAKSIHIPATTTSYRVTAPLVITTGITIHGDGTNPYGTTGPNNNRGRGSWLFLDHAGIGFNAVSAAGVNFIATVKYNGIGTFRNHTAVVGPGWTPNVFDYDFIINNTDAIFDDVMIHNAYKAIQCLNGNAGRITIDNVRGQWFNTGINIDNALDVVRINNVHQWPFWNNQTDITSYQSANLSVITLARCDNPQLSNIFSIYSNVGIGLFQNASGKTVRIKATNVEFDSCNLPLSVDAAVNGSTGKFTNFSTFGQTPASTNGYGVRILGSNCRFEFFNIEGANLSRSLIRVEGTANIVEAAGIRADTWNVFGGGDSLLVTTATNTLNIVGRATAEGTVGLLLFAGGTIRYPGFVAGGVATVLNGTTSLAVSHTLALTPTGNQIQVWPTTGWSAATEFWVDTITATQFTIRVDVNPGANVSFAWRAALE